MVQQRRLSRDEHYHRNSFHLSPEYVTNKSWPWHCLFWFRTNRLNSFFLSQEKQFHLCLAHLHRPQLSVCCVGHRPMRLESRTPGWEVAQRGRKYRHPRGRGLVRAVSRGAQHRSVRAGRGTSTGAAGTACCPTLNHEGDAITGGAVAENRPGIPSVRGSAILRGPRDVPPPVRGGLPKCSPPPCSWRGTTGRRCQGLNLLGGPGGWGSRSGAAPPPAPVRGLRSEMAPYPHPSLFGEQPARKNSNAKKGPSLTAALSAPPDHRAPAPAVPTGGPATGRAPPPGRVPRVRRGS